MKFYLVEVEIVIERDHHAEFGLVPEPCDGVPADWEKNQSHVELGQFCTTFGNADAVAHNVEHGSLPVLVELPGEKADHGDQPHQEQPHPLPVVFQEVLGLFVVPLEGVALLGGPQFLAQHLT